MNYKHSAYIWKLIAKLQQHELRTAREGYDVALITVTSLGALARALEAQAAKIAELEAAVRALRDAQYYEYGPTSCVWCGDDLIGETGEERYECTNPDCPWLTSGKLVGE